MDISKRDIVTQKLNNIPQHLMDEVIKYLDFLQYKSNTEDIELEKALNKALEDVKNNKLTPHNKVMASLKGRFSN